MGSPSLPGAPVLLVGGIDIDTMEIASLALSWDLPHAVSVRHDLDPVRDRLVRTVSDITGIIERVELELDHSCVACAIREDVVPTLERLAASGRWQGVLAQLSATAEPWQVCRALSLAPQDAPHVSIAAVVVALSPESLLADLVGGEPLTELDLPVRPDDERTVSEVACSMVEYADVVFTPDRLDPTETEVLTALMRPDAQLATSVAGLDAAALASGVHQPGGTESWAGYVRRDPLPELSLTSTWVLDFRSPLPLHPGRFKQLAPFLGGGPRRSRGCFWLPSRPHQACLWEGAGGRLSVGVERSWRSDEPLTRIVVVGIDEGRDQLESALRSCLLTEDEVAARGTVWEVSSDGLEPWLGPVHQGPLNPEF